MKKLILVILLLGITNLVYADIILDDPEERPTVAVARVESYTIDPINKTIDVIVYKGYYENDVWYPSEKVCCYSNPSGKIRITGADYDTIMQGKEIDTETITKRIEEYVVAQEMIEGTVEE